MRAVRLAAVAAATVAFGPTAPARAQEEAVEQSLCRLIEGAAGRHALPVGFLTRLIWQESSFRPHVTSPAGAQGVAQFMPGTARERGLADPFDPEQAIPAAASFLTDLRRAFGNLGLAAAAYNGGPSRVSSWLAGRGGLPAETRDYVVRITGRSAEDWAADRNAGAAPKEEAGLPDRPCLTVTAELKRGGFRGISVMAEGAMAPWGVQLAGNFSKSVALASFARSRARLASVLGDVQPMILGSRLRSRGRGLFYRVRVPAQTRAEANALCTRIRSAGGACAVLRT
ncbi:lytic transglycosylase domain-containing protein [Enterovirga aerilata]|uniref:Lytic transglycosylase domain-containing protein n=1 Tax=Enterovirga aerilata TaxID=2730920 RepID=A0A849ICJ7_9HYPH|nr:lytic transglycosylase domain-containing protein [Enterovirga sp. DB1703]NNM75128.1 lytic transglycosylase domain-containing protein [Enterovirga sp. DB1703]